MQEKPKRLVRKLEAMRRLGLARTAFHANIVEPKLLRFFRVGRRAVACLESDLDALIDQLAAGGADAPQRRRQVPRRSAAGGGAP